MNTKKQMQVSWKASVAILLGKAGIYDANLNYVHLSNADGFPEDYGWVEYRNVEGRVIYTSTLFCFMAYTNNVARAKKVGMRKIIRAYNISR